MRSRIGASSSTLGHRTRSAQVPKLVVHPRVKWFEVGGQGGREAGRGSGAKRGSQRRAQIQIHGGSSLNGSHRACEVGQQQQQQQQQQQGQGWVGLWQMDQQEPKRAVQEYRQAAGVLQWYSS